MTEPKQQTFGEWWRSQTASGRAFTFGALAILVFGLGSYCSDVGSAPGQSEPTTAGQYVGEYGGQAAAYERILTMSDCAALQGEFDIAADNNDRATAGTDESRWTLGYMEAADARMEAVGCYD